MSRYTLTLLGLMLMAGFGIFFGIEIATRGMEQIQGPVTATAPVRHYAPTPIPSPKPSVLSPASGSSTPTAPPIGAGVPAWTGDSGVNRIGNRIGDLLQGVAHQTIRAVVGVFDGLIN